MRPEIYIDEGLSFRRYLARLANTSNDKSARDVYCAPKTKEFVKKKIQAFNSFYLYKYSNDVFASLCDYRKKYLFSFYLYEFY